jgi:hypothetical protein
MEVTDRNVIYDRSCHASAIKNVKEGIFTGHCVKELANDGKFYEALKETVKRTLGAFILILTTFWAAIRRPQKTDGCLS